MTHICWDQLNEASCELCLRIVHDCPPALRCHDAGLQCYRLQLVSPLLDRHDHTDKWGFDNAGQSAMTMFSMATLDDWQGFSNAYRAAGTVHKTSSLFLGAFVIVVSLTGVNFLLSAIAFAYIKVRSAARHAEIARAAEDTVVMSLLETNVLDETQEDEPHRTSWCFPDALIHVTQEITSHQIFEGFIMAVVMLNIILMAADHYPKSDTFVATTEYIEIVFYVVYVSEMTLKLTALGWRGYLHVGLNRLDFIIVVAASATYLSMFFDTVLPDLKDAAFFRILRMSRLLRAARVAKIILRSDDLRRMLSRAFAAKDAILSLCFLLLFFLALAAIVAKELFKKCTPEDSSSRPRPNF
eukprot:SAG11_NODE_4378_length_1925_cov_1.348850_1_plen_354_part_10